MPIVKANAKSYLREKCKFQRMKREPVYLPFYEKLSTDADEWFMRIKCGLISGTRCYAADSGLAFWMNQLSHYLTFFNLRFSKKDHIRLTKFFYNVILEPDYDNRFVHKACSILKTLCINVVLRREDLTLPWRPVYELYKETVYGRNEKCIDKTILRETILCIKKLFPLPATREILQEIRPYIDLWNEYAMERFIKLFATLVPFQMSVAEHVEFGAALWFDELWHFYEFVEVNNTTWERNFQFVFSGLAKYCPGYVDWTPRHTVIFSKLLRTLDLSVRGGKVTVGGGADGCEQNGAEWIVWMLGGANDSAEKHLERLMRCVESFLHPLHEGMHTTTLQSFLTALVSEMVHRVRIERVCRKKKIVVPERLLLSDRNIESFVSIILPSVLYAVFSTFETKTPSHILRNLAFLAPNLVLPKVLDLVYPSLWTVTEPNRLQRSLDCLIEICVPLVRDNGRRIYETFNICERDWISEIDEDTASSATNDIDSYSHSYSRTDSEKEARTPPTERKPLRRHAITLLGALVEALDINDVNKLSLAFRALESFFTLIPIVDCSAAVNMIKYNNLSEEEKLLCEATGRLPTIVEKFVERVFKLISQLDIDVPKDSTTTLDSICDISRTTAFGKDEMLISRRIQGAFHSLLTNSSSAIVKQVAYQTYKFVTCSQFENAVAVEAVCVLIQECTYANPSKYFHLFLTHISANLDQLITDEVKKEAVLEPTVVWFICLAMMLFSVPGKLLLKYHKKCVDLHKMLISLKCANAYRMACWSLKNVLTQLAEIYPDMEGKRHRELDLPLEVSLPIRKWGAAVRKDMISMRWHVPSDEELQFAQNILTEFVRPEIERLQKPNGVDKQSIKKALYVIEKLISCVGRLIPEFNTPVLMLVDTRVPMNVKPLYNGPPSISFTFGGKCIRESIRKCMHDLLDYLLDVRDDEWKNFQWIAYIQYFLTTKGSSSHFRAQRSSSGLSYQDPIQGKRADLYRSFEKRIFTYQKSIRNRLPIFTESHLAIMKDLIRLGTNVYTAVRVSAQSYLNAILARFPHAKTYVVGDIIAYLDPTRAGTTHGEKKGALYMLITGGFISSQNTSVKHRCWPAIAKLDCSDRPLLIKLVTAAIAMVNTASWKSTSNVTSVKLRLLTRQCLENTDNHQLNNHDDEEDKILNESMDAFRTEKVNEQQKIASLRSCLIDVCKNEGQLYHWRNVDAARTLLFTFYKYHFDVESAKVFLQMLHEGRGVWRRVGASCLAGWMEWNKPKFVRQIWTPPAKIALKEDCYACGLRVDNLCLAYDKRAIPLTKEAWDKTPFISKPHWGAYQWPKQLSRPASSDMHAELLRKYRSSNPIGDVIVSTLRDRSFFMQWHTSMLREKEDSDIYYTSEFLLLKYLFRNYFTEMLPVMKKVLKGLMRGNQKGQQRLAAVYFAGLIRGSRNWPFDELNQMWSWLKPLLVAQIEGILSDSTDHWEGSLKLVLENVDLRKVYWLVETVFEVSSKPAPTAWHTCMRFTLIRYIATCAGWRSTDLVNRATALAQEHIAVAFLETERNQIACLLAYPAVYRSVQHSMKNVPKRFRIMDVDDIMSTFIDEVKSLMDSLRSGTPYKAASESTLLIEELPKSTSSAESARIVMLPSKTILYMKTLLKFLAAYYGSAFTAFSNSVISIIPLIAHLANEETARIVGVSEARDDDLAVGSSNILFQILSGIFLPDRFADEVLDRIKLTLLDTENWRVWISIMRFLHVFVFSNVFVLEMRERPSIVRDLVHSALIHPQAEVRIEASDCLTSLIHCGHYVVENEFIESLFVKANDEDLSLRHGAILGLSAIICAFPFTIPPNVVGVIIRFCKHGSSKDSIIRVTVTNTLRSFLNTHHDKLSEHCNRDAYKPLVDAIRNVMSPNYYV
uniref:Proteasome activator complex subunit 4 n=1 Tax=Ascaris suum TaxID=6253 RepID=F1KQG9_ASCSU